MSLPSFISIFLGITEALHRVYTNLHRRSMPIKSVKLEFVEQILEE